MAITTLFVDIGGVLLTNGWGGTLRKLAAETFDLDYNEMNALHHETFDTFEIGKLSLSEYLDRVVFYKPRPFSKEKFIDFMLHSTQPFPEMIALVQQLKREHNLRIAAVSNEGRELTDYRIKTFKLGEFIDFFVISSYVHLRKPDEDIYRLALDLSQVKPSEAAYIDDREMYVDVANKLGIHGICHKTYQETKTTFESLWNS